MRTTNTDNLKRTHKATVLNFRLSCYHLATKLWEGYVFTGVCHSVHRGVGTSNASWDSSDGRGYPLAPPLGHNAEAHPLDDIPIPLSRPPAIDIWWWPLETCSNLFISGLIQHPPLEWHLVVATETERGTVSKWAVCILLECLLANYANFCVYYYKNKWI